MICNAAVVTLLSYCCLSEVVSRVQVLGIVVIIVAVALVSLFPPDAESSDQTPGGVHDISSSGGATSAAGKQMALVVMWGVIGGVFLSFEIMSNKWLMVRRGVNGDISGMFFLLVEGIIGTTCLLVTTWQGGGLHELSSKSFGMVIIAGILAFSGLVIINYAIAKGLAGADKR